MFKRNPAIVLILLSLVIVLGLGVTACTPEELQALQATLKNVDSATGNVTVTLRDGTSKTFNFSDVTVETIRQALGNASLIIGDNITVRANRDGEVKKLQVKNAEAGGPIKAIATDNTNITIITKKGDLTVKVTEQTIIRMGDKVEKGSTVKLTDLKVGYRAEIKYDVSNNEALRINVNSGIVNSKGQNSDNGSARDGKSNKGRGGEKDD
jgi:outer membrane lipoprotein-sorting protein